MSNTRSLLIRPLHEDEIGAFRTIEKSARTRYRSLGNSFAQAVEAPAIAAERFVGCEAIVAELRQTPVGFLPLRPLDGLAYIANVSVSPNAAGLGIGRLLMMEAEQLARQFRASGLSLTTFRTPPWNGPWFHRQGYSQIPETRIGPGLRAILDRHATFHDMATRETLWKPTVATNETE
jgi:GNAT superfamily N-acetyltransferase